jgi:hypothetical protein
MEKLATGRMAKKKYDTHSAAAPHKSQKVRNFCSEWSMTVKR